MKPGGHVESVECGKGGGNVEGADEAEEFGG